MTNDGSETRPLAALYLRISQDRDGSSTSTDRQEKDLRALADREGWDVEVFSDSDISAYKVGPRPGFDRMLEELPRFDVLAVWKLDRLIRRFTGFSDVLKSTDAAGVRLVSIHDALDTSTPVGMGMAGMIAAMGEQESRNISIRVARAVEESASAGRPHGHRRSFGYSPTMEIVPDEADAIRDARDRILEGESMSSICRDWNRRGVKPTTAPAWRTGAFRQMITGPHLAARRVYKGSVVGDGTWEPIITSEEHERIVAKLTGSNARGRGRPPTYLLSGLTRCGKCGSVLRSGVVHKRRVLRCRQTPGEPNCGGVSINADSVEEIVTEALLGAIDDKAVARARKVTPEAPSMLAELEAKLLEIADDYDFGTINRAEWLHRRDRTQSRIDAERARLAKATSTEALGTIEGRLRDAWPGYSIDRRRAVFKAVIDYVEIGPSTRPGVFDPDRVNILWRV